MKTIFTLLFSSIFTFVSMAYEGARITISSINNNRMYVEVDGRRYQMNEREISIRDLRTGHHTIKIYRDGKKSIRIWNFGIGNRKQETVYNNRIYLREGHHFDIVVNRFGKVMVDERRIDRNDDWYEEDDDWNDNDRDGNRDRDNRNNRDNRDNRDNRYDNNGRVMSDHEFNEARESLQREWFENNRVTIAKQIFDRNYFLSRQVKELLQLFTFENNKLDLAKYAYGRTTDKSVFYIVNDVFAFKNSREKLAKYIREYR